MWRHEWEATKSPEVKTALLTYKEEDCQALEIVTNKVIELYRSSPENETASINNVVHTDRMKRDRPCGFKRNTFSFPELDVINNAAYWDYQRGRVYLKRCSRAQVFLRRPPVRSRKPLPPNKTITYPRPRRDLPANAQQADGRFTYGCHIHQSRMDWILKTSANVPMPKIMTYMTSTATTILALFLSKKLPPPSISDPFTRSTFFFSSLSMDTILT